MSEITTILNNNNEVLDDTSKTITTTNVGDTNVATSGTQGDDVSVVKDVVRNYFSAVRMRTPIEPEFRYNKFPKHNTLPHLLEMDFSRILNKPYFIKSIPWFAGVGPGLIQSIKIPEDIWNNPLAKIPFTAATYYRAKVELILQVSGTPMHAGLLLASALPDYTDANGEFRFNQNRMLAAPHVFLSANESTPVVLEVPFYVNSKLAAIDLDGNTIHPSKDVANYCRVDIAAWNPLVAPQSGSTELSISVHVVFRELEFYNPHIIPNWVPIGTFKAEGFVESMKYLATSTIDNLFSCARTFTGDLLDKIKYAANDGLTGAREWIRGYTGLHAPELPYLDKRTPVTYKQNVNLVDAPSYFEKLDPYGNFTHIVNDFVFDTDVDEMSISEIVNKPQYLGTFKVRLEDPVGKLLWSRPITPLQEYMETKKIPNLLTTGVPVASLSTNLLQTLALMSKYWRGSLKIHIQSAMSNFHFCKLAIARNYSPEEKMRDSYPLFQDITNLLTETVEFSAGGQVQTIELPYLSLMEQLPVSSDWEFNALEHGVYYIYLYQPLVFNGSVSKEIEFNVYISAGDDFDLMGYATLPMLRFRDFIPTDSFVAEATAPVPVNNQADLCLTKHFDENSHPYDLRPIKSVRDFTRRFNKVYSGKLINKSLDDFEATQYISVGELLGLQPIERDTLSIDTQGSYVSPLDIVSSMFLGYTGGMKFKIYFSGTSAVEAWYIPPAPKIENGVWRATIPLKSTASGSSTVVDHVVSDQFKFPNPRPNTTINPTVKGYISPTVTLERPVTSYGQSDKYFMIGPVGTEGEDTAMITSWIEFEIPYMSPLRFVGSADKTFACPKGSAHMHSFNGDLGNILLKIAPPFSGDRYPFGVYWDIYAATTDEGRFGYQVFSPAVSTGAIQLNGVSLQPIATLEYDTGDPPVSRNAGVPACYYNSS